MNREMMLLVLLLSHLTLAITLGAYQLGRERSTLFRFVTLARLLQAVAWCLLYVGQSAGISQIEPIAYAFLFTGILADAAAFCVWAERPDWQRPMLWLFAALAIAYFALEIASVPIGLTSSALVFILSIQCGTIVIALAVDWARATSLRMVLGIGQAGLILLMLSAALLEWSSGVVDHALSVTSLICLYLFALMSSVGLLLLTREQVDLEMTRLATVDTLSGAPNRRGFFHALAPWMALARRPGQSTSIIVLELDDFKRIKENYGHAVADLVIRTMVEIGQKQLRDSDLIGRLGGEEFAVLLPRTDLSDAVVVAERMRHAIMDAPIKTERAVIYTTASFGVTTIRPDDDVVALFKRADEARIQAKKLGGNRVAEAAPICESSV